MFWKKQNNEITIKITQTSNEAERIRKIKEQAFEQSCICPECNFKNNKTMDIGFITDDGTQGYYGECLKCGAKWEVTYNL
ncbi:TPA: hypothetical protein N2D16_002719 [Clostridium botulinum]|nr:hypothetical protein [Clostridium botulinum]HCL4455093.1 hypothetical protein [Clostridium botulinum]